MLKALSIFISLLFSGQIMATEFESRQAFLLIGSESADILKFDSINPEIPSFSLEPESDFSLIPVSAGTYSVEATEVSLDPYKINFVSFKRFEGRWVKSTGDIEAAKEYLEINYPILNFEIVIK